jgi:MoaA/NifB/PqqE/SkfB family radical SAM enzyme
MLATWHFHIEISSKCTLRCPRCARQEVPDSLVNTELDLEFFKRNFTPEFIKTHVEKITFCGNDGDPIYAHDLIPVIEYIKSVKPVQIVIITNGSYKKPEWWQDLAKCLNFPDQVHFSLDGWDQPSNNQYRVNSDWESITQGINILRSNSDCWMVWATIAFKFNEQYIPTMQSMAKDFGFDRFQLTLSTKFSKVYNSYGLEDNLHPSDELVSTSGRFERVVTNLSDRLLVDPARSLGLTYFSKSEVHKGIRPLCTIGSKGLYIDSQGRLYPCCWVANRYSHNSDWHNSKFDLKNKNISKCLVDLWQTTFFNLYDNECQSKCKLEIVDKDYYAIEW